MKRFYLFIVLLNIVVSSYAQWFPKLDRKGNVYAAWGWNREVYSKSDISFKGEDYNFKLKNVIAHDRQTPFSFYEYFEIQHLTVPQTNMRYAYFFKNNWAISFGVDHMKYVMDQDKIVGISGFINDTNYSKNIVNNKINLSRDFLAFEHTDGLNYLNFELEYFQGLFEYKKFQVNGIVGAGAGAMMPRTDVKLMGYPRNDKFHLAGFGVDIKTAIEFLFWKRFFIKIEAKAGYINMPDIVTRKASISDRAKQQFFFGAVDGMLGVNIPLIRK
jgi:hypothetical protein